MEELFVLYVDGASQGNPGPSGLGLLLINPSGETVAEIAEPLGKVTNNVAEYRALLRGLKEARLFKVKQLQVYSDSQLLVRQLNGDYKVKHTNLRHLFEQALEEIEHFQHVSIEHIPREKNREADRLAKKAAQLNRKKHSS